MTIYEEKEELEGVTLAFVGDGNNVAHANAGRPGDTADRLLVGQIC
jgi:hypothetical protein